MISTAQSLFLRGCIFPELAESAVGVLKKQPGRNYTFTTLSWYQRSYTDLLLLSSWPVSLQVTCTLSYPRGSAVQ